MYCTQILKGSKRGVFSVMSQKLDAQAPLRPASDEEPVDAETMAQIYALLNRPSPPF